MNKIECVVIGDGTVGKTCLLKAYTTNTFIKEYITTVFDNYSTSVMFNGEAYTLSLSDTTGPENHAKLQQLSYSQADVFLVCFSVVLPSSFENVEIKWVPEIREYCSHTPFLLVGTKTDLRNDVDTVEKLQRCGQQPITPEIAKKKAKDLNAVKYIECSAFTQQGLQHVFNGAIAATLKLRKKRQKQKCRII
ncbi:cell division control protein 42 homolog [Saccoglossus kowalevskii]|uniref:Cell division control protein 42 homolog n=1 Tax=Saccoglossus kowalevskii TaxID=10224 RepID=A0ABM0GWZ1_SACKO|nr:PREDICTED: cell division control protein 42 homolog [Saccoglossus kowalevskii]